MCIVILEFYVKLFDVRFYIFDYRQLVKINQFWGPMFDLTLVRNSTALYHPLGQFVEFLKISSKSVEPLRIRNIHTWTLILITINQST